MNMMRLPNNRGRGVTYCKTYSYDIFCSPLAVGWALLTNYLSIASAGCLCSLPVPTAFHIFLKSLCLIQSVLVHRIIKSLGSIIFVIIMPSLYIKRFPPVQSEFTKHECCHSHPRFHEGKLQWESRRSPEIEREYSVFCATIWDNPGFPPSRE